MTALPPRVSIERLSVRLGSTLALSAVSIGLDQPGVVALAGPNGAGKSTLLRVMAGLQAPAAGRVAIDGADVGALPAHARARQLAYMPQDRHVHWDLSARNIVALGRLPHMAEGAALSATDEAAVDAALRDVDAVHLAHRPILSLSGGERARVLMARALAQNAGVLLADEPAAGLDPAHQWALFETLARIGARGTRVVVATHDLTLIARFAATVVLLADGRMVAHGAPLDVLTPDRLAQIYGIASARIGDLIVATGLATKHIAPGSSSPDRLRPET